MAPVPPEQYAPKHRAAPAPTQPLALVGPRHVGERGSSRRARRSATRITFGGLAAAATGVAVAAGVVHTPGAPVNLADSLAPVAAAADQAARPSARRPDH